MAYAPSRRALMHPADNGERRRVLVVGAAVGGVARAVRDPAVADHHAEHVGRDHRVLGEARRCVAQRGAAVELVDDGGSLRNQCALSWNTAWNRLVTSENR